MITNNIGPTNVSNSCNSSSNEFDKRIDALEKTNSDQEKYFSSQHIYTPKLDADEGNISTVKAGSVDAKNVNGGAGTFDNLAVDGNISAKSFNITDPVNVKSVTTERVDAGIADVTDVIADNAKIKNLTVDNLTTSPDGSLEYKNISVTQTANINKLNLNDPHINTVNMDTSNIVDLTVQNTVLSTDGYSARSDNGQSVIRFTPTETVIGDLDNGININTKTRPRWNDNLLATIADIQQGGVKPVYKGMVDTYDQLPIANNVKGDLYIVKNLVIADQKGIGHAQFNGLSWDPTLIYELRLYDTIEDVDKKLAELEAKLMEVINKETEDAIARETDIINGTTPVQKIATGANNSAGKVIATTENVADEAKTRSDADTALGTRITDEETARKNDVKAIRTELGNGTLKANKAAYADNSGKLNNKTEANLSVNYAKSAGSAGNASKLNNKTESSLSVNYAANSGKLENKTKAQVITEARSGMSTLQAVFDMIHPVGDVIMRLPDEKGGGKTPQEKWGAWSHWVKLDAYTGRFPRVTGLVQPDYADETPFGGYGDEEVPDPKPQFACAGNGYSSECYGIGFSSSSGLGGPNASDAGIRKTQYTQNGTRLFNPTAWMYKVDGHNKPAHFGVELWKRDK